MSKLSFNEKYSRWPKLLWICSLVFKFIKKIKKKKNKNNLNITFPFLSIIDCQTSYNFLIKYSQKIYLPAKDIKQNLNLFLNEKKILKCKGRLHNSQIKDNIKYLIYLPPKSFLTKLITLKSHITSCHSGILNTLSLVRKLGRRIFKQIIYNLCILCRKLMAKLFVLPAPPPLPINRVCPVLPFQNLGDDFCGLFLVRVDKKD